MTKRTETTTKRMRVQFMDEAPRIGNGWRIVDVEEGWKWVRVRDCLGNRAKFTKAQWEKIADNASVLGPVKRRRRKTSNKRTAAALNASGVFRPFICIPGGES